MTKIDDTIRRFNTHAWIPQKDRTAVLLVDLQEYFREIIDPVLDNIVRVVSATREENIPLIFTQHGHTPKADHGLLGQWWTDLIFEGSMDARLLPELEAAKKDLLIPKNTYSAFHGTHLEGQLKKMNVEDLVLGGVMTNLCCETTARDAFVRDFRVFFLVDGTSTVSEDLHIATLKNLGYGFATLLSCRQFVRMIQE